MNCNTVTLMGRVSKNPTLEYQKDGKLPVMKFGLLVSNPTENERDSFYFIKRFGSNAEIGVKMIKAGDEVMVVGRMHSFSANNNGEFKYHVEVVADWIGFDTSLAFGKKFSREDGVVGNSVNSYTPTTNKVVQISSATNNNTTSTSINNNVVNLASLRDNSQAKVNLVAEKHISYGRMHIPDNIDSLLGDNI